eukprot:Nitzschia sp. Nitz4//scaffold233_size31335//65//1012//NITZ4_007945-RA/size31335-processed-gene-0.7-mRNA-1//-1//CDS//3329543361//8112//frame0
MLLMNTLKFQARYCCQAFQLLPRSSILTTAATTATKWGVSPTAATAPTLLAARSLTTYDPSSTISTSRRPFRMPANSPDDSKANVTSTPHAPDDLASSPWSQLGLHPNLTDCLENKFKLSDPTPVQSIVIPQLLASEPDPSTSLAFLAATGSGKTLAYLLPLMQQLKEQETTASLHGFERRPRRPRLVVLAPTRELALQITDVMKSLSHSIKLSSQALVGGQDRGDQRKSMARRPVDVVVATPGRLLQHWKDGTIFLGSVQTIVLDEMDTMLEQGFQKELRSLLHPLLFERFDPSAVTNKKNANKMPPLKEGAPRI